MRITVFAGSSRQAAEPFLAVATALGAEIARRGHDLVYGGGRTGLMGALADGALAAGGRVHGVILRRFIDEDVHHLGVEMCEVDDMRARKAGLDERADAFVALPGGLGTLEELAEVLSFRKLGLHHRPVVLLDAAGFWDPLLEWLGRAIDTGFEKPTARAWWAVAGSAARAVELCETLAATATPGEPGRDRRPGNDPP
ncbi:MAG: TIGR00730 family Rossman fold protein [Deltaproteobacteria bacterium]|nr:TIGR00730 family Rossman fold protein [Deltaproteobacteria bacterium]